MASRTSALPMLGGRMVNLVGSRDGRAIGPGRVLAPAGHLADFSRGRSRDARTIAAPETARRGDSGDGPFRRISHAQTRQAGAALPPLPRTAAGVLSRRGTDRRRRAFAR